MRRRLPAVLAVLSLLIGGVATAPHAVADDEPRTLFFDDFSSGDGAQWSVATANAASSVTFAGGRATIIGSGPENRMMSKDVILADSFTLGIDLYIDERNTNSAIKFGFLASDAGASRFQVTYDGPHSTLALEQVINAETTVLATADDVALAVNTESAPYRVEIDVDGDAVTAAIDGEVLLDVAGTGAASAAQGSILVASQFPNQAYSVDDVRVTTTEPERLGEYTVETRTMTDGVEDADPGSAGGTLTANRSSGDAGDIVALSPAARPGYVFDGYEPLRADTGTSTDGLLTIDDDRFTLDDKTGSVIIIARFITEPEDPNTLFTDYFEGGFNDHGAYTLSGPGSTEIVDGALLLSAGASPQAVTVDASAWGEPADYRIVFAASKANASAGTMQIAFRVDGLDDRYVLALNGSKALLRRLDATGGNVELASALYTFDQTTRTMTIEVAGDTVSVSSDGTPVLSYTSDDGWSGIPAGLALINLTDGAPVVIDNVRVARVPSVVGVTVAVTADGVADDDLISGVAVLSTTRLPAGGTLTWTTHAKGGYLFDGLSFDGAPVTGGEFTVPSDATGDIMLTAAFVSTDARGSAHYIDPTTGDDAASGTSPDDAWASLAALNGRLFGPGDSILLRSGSVFDGAAAELAFAGSGSSQAPLMVGAYGDGPRPQLNGAGAVENVVSLYNQEYVTITGLEITNLDPAHETGFALNGSTNRSKNLRAVNVSARDFGVVRGIEISDLHIHDVNGNLDAKWNGGIFFDITADVHSGELRGTPTKFDDVLVAGNVLERVDRSGIKLVSSHWANQSLTNNPTVPLNWYPSTGVVVRDNILRHMGGDAITVRDTDGALIEHNLAQHSRYQNTGYNAGIWPFQATNTVIQYNEVSNTHGVQDGQGFDTDHVSSYSVVQYNYSHDNEGGFMLIMNGFPHTAPTIRYNISENDADKTFEFARGTAAGTMIHNNTIHSDTILQGPRGGVLDLANSAAGTGNREVFIFNNVFDYPEGQTFYVGEVETMRTKAQLFNNAYTGGITAPAEEQRAITGEAMLADAGTAPETDLEAAGPRTGPTAPELFAGYAPTEDSVLRGAGVSVTEVVERFGGTVTDRSDLSPTEIHAQALAGESIDFVAADNMPVIDGVSYSTDFLGTALPQSGAVTRVVSPGDAETLSIGAIQYVAAETDDSGDGVEQSDGGEAAGSDATTDRDATGAGSQHGGLAATGGAVSPLAVAAASLLLLLGAMMLRMRARRDA
ncbi:right-handed parallel beta-helix repeat-containing protein [Microbacterium sp. GXF6406]